MGSLIEVVTDIPTLVFVEGIAFGRERIAFVKISVKLGNALVTLALFSIESSAKFPSLSIVIIKIISSYNIKVGQKNQRIS